MTRCASRRNLLIPQCVMSIGKDHVLLCGPPGCGMSAWIAAHKPPGVVHINHAQQPRLAVPADATLWLESIAPREHWQKQNGLATMFPKVVYWEDATSKEPHILDRRNKADAEAYLLFWGL